MSEILPFSRKYLSTSDLTPQYNNRNDFQNQQNNLFSLREGRSKRVRTFSLEGQSCILKITSLVRVRAAKRFVGAQPGTLVGNLNSPSSYSATLAATNFSTSGLSLAANTQYWVVLNANSGAFDWSWTGVLMGVTSTFGT